MWQESLQYARNRLTSDARYRILMKTPKTLRTPHGFQRVSTADIIGKACLAPTLRSLSHTYVRGGQFQNHNHAVLCRRIQSTIYFCYWISQSITRILFRSTSKFRFDWIVNASRLSVRTSILPELLTPSSIVLKDVVFVLSIGVTLFAWKSAATAPAPLLADLILPRFHLDQS